MKIQTGILILLIAIILSSCCNQTTIRDSGEDPSNKLPADLLKQKSENIISPGTADITGQVLSYKKSELGVYSLLKVLKINNSGSSTPPLAIGSEIKCDIPENLVENVKPELTNGQTHKFLIQYQFAANNRDTISSWRVINIK